MQEEVHTSYDYPLMNSSNTSMEWKKENTIYSNKVEKHNLE